jgi:hypothetical protein
MKFLIQTNNNQVIHDFSFTLLKSLEYQNWHTKSNDFEAILTNYYPPEFVPDAVPCGSNDFVVDYLNRYYHKTPKPRNIPLELMPERFTHRMVMNGTREDVLGRQFVKSNDKIKDFAGVFYQFEVPESAGCVQISDLIDIDSEWRSFVYHNKLVGLQNYSGEFTMFPDVAQINKMIKAFEPSAPVAYTLDVGINSSGTFVIEVHDFFSCGLYGFADHRIYPFMLSRWFYEFIK